MVPAKKAAKNKARKNVREKAKTRTKKGDETPVKLPDFEARLQRIFGDRIVEPSGAEIISEDREGR